MVLFSLILTAIQCSFIHVHIDNSLADRPVVLRRGLSSLAFLPPPLDPEILIDTGLNQQDINSTQRDSLEGVRIGRWTDAGYLARLLIPYLNRGSAGRWLCYQDDWQQGLRLLSQSQYDKNQLLALIAIDPAAAQQALQVLANDADKTVRAFSAAVLEGLAPYDRASFISADTVVRTHPDSGPAAPAIIPLLTSPHRSDSAAGNLANLTLAELLQALDNSASDIRSNAAKILKTKHLNTQQAQYVTSALLARLRTRVIYERLATLKILQNKTIINYISQNDAAFSALLEQFHDSSHRVRQAMVVLLRNMTLHPAQTRLAVAYLTGLLENVDKDIRFSATAALQHLILTEEQQVQIVNTLIAELGQESGTELPRIVQVLQGVSLTGTQYSAMVDALIQRLADNQFNALTKTFFLLRQLRLNEMQVQSMIKALIRRLDDPRMFVVNRVSWFLQRLPLSSQQNRAVSTALMRHLDVGDVDGLTPLVNTLGQLPLDDAQRLTLQNTIIARLHRADDYVIDRSIALLKNLDLTPQQTHQVGQILEPYLATAYTPLWQSAATAILQIQPDLQPGDALFKKIYASVFSRLDSPDGATRYAAGSVIHELITDEQRFNLVLQALLRRLDEPAGDPLYQVVAGVLDTANPYRLDAESQKRIMPVLNHPDQRLRQQAITILAKHLLLLNQAISDNAVADSLLKNLIEDPQARRHAGYRRALIQALAYWYNAGIAHSDARAVEEHENLQEQLQLLREKTLPWWLRTAATEVLTTAYQLRP